LSRTVSRHTYIGSSLQMHFLHINLAVNRTALSAISSFWTVKFALMGVPRDIIIILGIPSRRKDWGTLCWTIISHGWINNTEPHARIRLWHFTSIRREIICWRQSNGTLPIAQRGQTAFKVCTFSKFWRSCERASLVYSFRYNQQDATFYNILYYCQCSHVSGGFSVHHQELKNCTHSIW
jgi:hypothetical protein